MNRHKRLYHGWLTLIGVLLLLGAYTAFKLLSEGHYLFNANDVIMWSLPLGAYIFLALSSSGLTLLAAIPLVLTIKRFEPFAMRLVFLSIATLCGAFVCIGLELGNPWHMVHIFLSPNLSSPIWWMGAIYGVELILLAGKFLRMHKGDWNSGLSKALGILSTLCALIAPLMIGSVFGITESRITYFGPVMSIYCLLMALLSGIALFILYSMVYSKVVDDGHVEKHSGLYEDMCKIFHYVTGVVIVFTLVKMAIDSATVVPEFLSMRKFEHLFGSVFGFHMETLLGLFLPFILLFFPSVREKAGGKLLIAALVWCGILAIHMEILIAGQSHPIGPKAEQYPVVLGYFPSVWEWLIFLFAIGVMLLIYTLGERYLTLDTTSS